MIETKDLFMLKSIGAKLKKEIGADLDTKLKRDEIKPKGSGMSFVKPEKVMWIMVKLEHKGHTLYPVTLMRNTLDEAIEEAIDATERLFEDFARLEDMDSEEAEEFFAQQLNARDEFENDGYSSLYGQNGFRKTLQRLISESGGTKKLLERLEHLELEEIRGMIKNTEGISE